ncbi:MAG: toll/interleukin-1 receptor domain-containing protein [Pseudomonadota bacterium]
MSMLKLFISHSSKTNASKQLLCNLCNALQANDNGCYVLVDKSGDIYPSDDWEQRLDEWLAECHAAVILVSEAALESWWVQKEATILKWRWRLDPNFKHLLIVLLDDLQEDVFQQDRFKILNLPQIQFLTGHNDDSAQIVAAIEKQLEKIEPADTAFDEMREAISDSLSDVKPKTMKRVCQKLQVDKRLGETPKWSGSDNTPQAAALARLILRKNESSLQTFNDVLNAIKPPIPADSAHWLYKTVFPLWVREEAAVLLPLSLIDEAGSSRRIAINGKKLFPFTAESFVRRAYPLDDDWVLIPIDSTKTQADAIAEEVRSYFREHITGDFNASESDTDKEIRTFPSPIYILLAENVTDEYILDELQAFYPNAEFLLSVGAEMPADTAIPAKANPITPPLDIHLEERQNTQMKRARNLLNKLPGGLHR